MRAKTWKRLISLILCVQMICAPAGYVFAAELPEQEGEAQEELLPTSAPENIRPEPEETAKDGWQEQESQESLQPEPTSTPTPTPAPAPEVTLEPEGSTQPQSAVKKNVLSGPDPRAVRGPGFSAIGIGFGNPVVWDSQDQKASLLDYDRYFAAELSEEWNNDSYGSRYDGAPYCYWDDQQSYAYFFFLPDELFLNDSPALGRIPDKQFDGWYIYTGDPGNSRDMWVYNGTSRAFETVIYQGNELEGKDFNGQAPADYEFAFANTPGSRWTGLIMDMEKFEGLWVNGSLPTLAIVGKWVPSNMADARSRGGDGEPGNEDKPGVSLSVGGAAQPLYATPIAGVPTGELTPVDFDSNRQEYYLRVDADVESLDLSFLAAEPYYDYHTAEGGTAGAAPVSVTLRGPGKSTSVVLETDSGMAPKAGLNGDKYVPMNSLTTPASSLWTVPRIPLTASGGEGKYYNDIVVRVTSPDGSRQKEYTFHVQRLVEPALTLNPGNTPLGMVARDETAALDKQQMAEVFQQTRKFDFDNNLFPMDKTHNNDGFIYRNTYPKATWGDEEDYDLSQTAIVAYQNAAFHDPGFTLTNSEGDRVSFGDAGEEGYQEAVKRTIVLRHAAKLTPNLIGKDGGTDRYYSGHALYEEACYEIIKSADGTDLVDLSKLNVLPGIYWIDYYYQDPVNGDIYDFEGNSFAPGYGSGAADFRRPLIVLPIPGDVNMDGVVNMSDAAALEETMILSSDDDILSIWGTSPQEDPVLRLVLYRALDVNGDGKVNKADVNALRTTFVNKLDRNMAGGPDFCTFFYLPLPGKEQDSRVSLTAPEENADGRAALRMAFLGKEMGACSDPEQGIYTSVTGPRTNADPNSSREAVELGDVFWVGVKLEPSNAKCLDQAIREFRFTLNYDSRYLAPATVLLQKDITDMGGAGGDASERWLQTLRLRNVIQETGKNVVWATGDYNLQAAATQPAAVPVFQADRGITLVELNAGKSARELVFSLQLAAGREATASLKDGEWLLMVPFKLIKHPYGETAPTLVEASMGSREFALTGAVKNAAFDARGGVAFGCAAENLRRAVYFPEGIGLPIRLGVNRTKAINLYNQHQDSWDSTVHAVYGDIFKVTHYADPDTGAKTSLPNNADESKVNEQLPPGLTFNNAAGITGTPEEAGTWEFVISGKYFRLTIEKAQLRYFAEFKERYYGERSLYDPATGTNGPEYTYRYYIGDIKELDLHRQLEGGVQGEAINDGRGEHLAALLGAAGPDAETMLQAPGFRGYYMEGGKKYLVDEKTPQGEYQLEPNGTAMATNYRWEWVDQYENPEITSFTANKLRILPRPIYMAGLAADYNVGTIFDDDPVTLLSQQVSTANPAAGVVLALPHDEGSPETYNKRSLTGPALVTGTAHLTLTFDAKFQQNKDDYKEMSTGNGKNFSLKGDAFTESRDVKVDQVSLIPNDASYNYLIAGQNTTPVIVKGSVTRREPSRIEIQGLPSQSYTYGDLMSNTAALVVMVYYGTGANEINSGKVQYNKDIYDSMYVNVCWVDSNQDADNSEATLLAAKPFLKNQVMTVEEMHGRYLCVWAYSKNADGTKQIITAYSEEPFQVSPRDLLLTADPVERYYGEENPTLTFHYDPNQLANRDWKAGLKGEGGELAERLAPYDYKAPTLAARTAPNLTAQELEARSPCTGANQAVTITGASAKNYRFLYSRPNGPGRAVDHKGYEDFGYNTFFIHPRPVMVESVTQESLATVYADTRTTVVEGISLGEGRFTLTLPTHTRNTTAYYPAGETSGLKELQIGYAVEEPVLEGDALSLTCDLRLLKDNSYWDEDLTHNYFDMDTAVDGQRSCRGEIRNLTLTGPSVGNYQLVYNTEYDARIRCPSAREYFEKTYEDGGTPETFVLSGYGTLVLRSIASIEIRALPKLDYTYGQQFLASAKGSAGLPLRVRVNYDTEYENDPQNTKWEEFDYKITGKDQQTGKLYNSFEERGLEVCYLPADEIPADHKITDGLKPSVELLAHGTYVTVGDHHGGGLVVRGQRPGQEGENGKNIKYSQVSAAPIQVAQKPLTLSVEPLHRYYGEPNGGYRFTFDVAELAVPDRDVVKAYNQEHTDQPLLAAGAADSLADRENAGSEPAACDLLEFVDSTYTAPTFQTKAWSGSNVVRQGYDGYGLTLSGGGMENYKLQYENSKVYIYRRPIQVDRIASTDANPIYTIYADTVYTRKFKTNASNSQVIAKVPASAYPNIADPAYTAALGNDPPSLALNVDQAVYGSDKLVYTVEVEFYRFPADGEVDLSGQSGRSQDVKVTSASLVPGNRENENYFLLDAQSLENQYATGMVLLRRITGIEITRAPKLEYTYGETLRLVDDPSASQPGLQVKITYAKVADEEVPVKVVDYLGNEGFHAEGLYVHYTTSKTVTAGESENLIDHGRVAQDGDHLTIAPSHDDPSFEHDGKYLVVSAQRHAAHDPVEPQMVRSDLSGANQGEALVVHPLELQYTLSATDKTYDHDGNTAGTLKLLNAFDQDGVVDAYNQNGVTDVVYVATGADYEIAGETHDRYTEFIKYVKTDGNGYTFTTGAYREKPYQNGLTYQPNYDRSKHLDFQFETPDVRYKGDTGLHTWGELDTIPVNVKNIALAGPDAKNYTISPAVTSETGGTADGYQGAGRPEATIHKADRVAPGPVLGPGLERRPGLELDVHTNAVRVDYKRDPDNDERDLQDAHDDGIHFEYALQSVRETNSVYRLQHVAGLDGRDIYQDELIFGGEAVTPGWPAGYMPDESKLPTAEDIKEDSILRGQVYGWAGEDRFFLPDPEAYPGGVEYPGYDLYKTERVNLDRDATYWGLVRIAETHNYKASPPLSTVEGMEAGTIQAAIDAELALRAAQTAVDDAGDPDRPAAEAALETAAAAASALAQALLGQAQDAVDGAVASAQARAAVLAEIGQTGQWPEEALPAATGAAPAVKTYRQRLDLISTTEDRGVGEGEAGENYTVPLLEAVWFTDLLVYEKKDVLDAVTANHDPSRYYGYYWDAAQSAEVQFEQDAPLDLTKPLQVECEVKDENGQTGKQEVTVNENATAKLYVRTQSGGGSILENAITILPRAVVAVLGDEPIQLTVQFTPAYVTIKQVSWSTSDVSVVTVDKKGLLTFHGAGTATITAVSSNAGRRDSITVKVLAPDSLAALFPDSVVDPAYTGALFELGRDLYFYPEQTMTRGELVLLLARLYRANENRLPGEALDFPDLTDEDEYAEAARLLSSLGIVTGVEDGSFAAGRVATRAELVTMVARMLGVGPRLDRRDPHAFADSGPDQTWAWGYIDALADAGLLRGVGGGDFAPNRELTRAETAAFLVRLLDESYLPAKETQRVPVDVSRSHWGYRPILRAVNVVRPPQSDK